MVINPFGTPLEYKISEEAEYWLEEHPKKTLAAIIAAGIACTINNPTLLQLAHVTQPLTVEQGYKLLAEYLIHMHQK